MENSWIKLHRKILDWGWYKDPKTKVIFIHLLLKANYEDCLWNGVEIKRGQRWTSVKSLMIETGLSNKEVRTALEKLSKGKEIGIQTANKGTMITICKYDEYQYFEKQTANKRQTTGQQIKNIDIPNGISLSWRDSFEIYKKECDESFAKAWENETWFKRQEELNPRINIGLTLQKAHQFWSSEAGWENKKSKRTKVINWATTIQNSLQSPMNKEYYSKEELAERDKE
jgi:hypothetical protein